MTTSSIPTLPLFLEICAETLNWQPSDRQQQQLQALYVGILDGNRQFNLTRITEPTEFWEKHIWDSLRGIAPWLPPSEPLQRVIDIGTGGGFPGLPVAIACPAWSLTLLDSTRKKIAFLQTLSQQLQLSQVSTLAERAEAAGLFRLHRECYDLALIRAVGPVTVCAEYALPFVKLGGRAVLYRGQWTPEEATSLENAVAQLGGAIAQVDAFETPLTQGTRHCLHIEKVALTPADFPREVGIPAKHPL
jgi:16S rRNA (guanine527-N7)-methyltransferase